MRRLRTGLLALASVACLSCVSAQTILPDNPDWAEAEVPPPPAFQIDKLIAVEVDAQGSLRYGVDPATLSIGQDGVVRYVMVARSSGAMTAMYEGLRCSTAEYKVYARYNGGRWTPVATPEWQSLRASSRVQHPWAFARQAGCDSRAHASSVQKIVERLNNPALAERYP